MPFARQQLDITPAARKPSRRDLRLLLLASAAGLSLAGSVGAAQAQTVIDGVTVDVPGTHASPWTLPDALIVADTGSGALNAGVGGVAGVVSATDIVVGNVAGSAGVITIAGAGSSLTGSGAITIGNSGAGQLTVSGGGKLATTTIDTVGAKAGSSGVAAITGAGSLWSNKGGLVVGSHGDGEVTVSDGGAITSGGNIIVGDLSDGHGELTVTGAGSKVSTNLGFSVGSGGTGDVSILAGGSISSLTATIGGAVGGSGTVTVNGLDSNLTATQTLTVGGGGIGVLDIDNQGGVVATQLLVLGNAFGGKGTVTLDGSSSLNASNGDLIVGNGGIGILSNLDGAVFSARGYLGFLAGSSGEATMNGTFAFWQAGDLIVGNAGSGTLTLINGGIVSAHSVIVGKLDGADGLIAVQNSGELIVEGGLGLGESGMGQLIVSAGGQVTTGDTSRLGNHAGSTGIATVDGAGSFWNGANGDMFIGAVAGTARLTISNGGRVTVDAGLIGRDGDEVGEVLVTGAGSRWEAASVIRVGGGGIGELTVADGGVVNIDGGTGFLNIAQGPASDGTVNIGGAFNDAAAAPGVLEVATIGFGSGNGALVLNHTAINYVLAAAMEDHGVILGVAGTTRLTGDSSGFTGFVIMSGGTLLVDNQLGAAGIDVGLSAALGGQGAIAGDVTILDGGALLGAQGQTLTMGSLSLSSGSIVNVTLGAPSAQVLFDVEGLLTLDGVVNVADGGGFGMGVYRLFDFNAMIDNGLEIGTTPGAGAYSIQTSVAGQVNLVSGGGGGGGGPLVFWDGGAAGNAGNGMIDGGGGAWSAVSPNWTDADGMTNGPMNPQPGFAVFEGAGGTVTVDGSAGAVAVTGMQFASDGYGVAGDAIGLAEAQTLVRVGDGTATGGAFVAEIGSELTGSGMLVKDDLGTLILSGDNSYTGNTWIKAGTLRIGAGGATGSILGDVINDGRLAFARSDETLFAGMISGSGEVAVQSGTVIFSTPQTYTGLTTIFSGAGLELLDGGGLSGDLDVDGTFTSWQNGTYIYGGSISGVGLVIQKGDGETRLTGDSSGYLGTTLVDTGTLRVDGVLGGLVQVSSGGWLKGYGQVGTTNISGGTIAPGGSIGTLTINGDLGQGAGSTYQLEVAPGVGNDLIVVIGQAILGGNVQLVKTTATPFLFGQRYTILTAAGGVSGTYDGLTGDAAPLSLFIGPKLSYDATHVYLDIAQFAALSSVALTDNQTAAADGADSLGAGSPLKQALMMLQTAGEARGAFDAISGEAYASAREALGEDARLPREAVLRRLSLAGLEGPGAWGEVFGGTGGADGDVEAGEVQRDVSGFLVGGDLPLGDSWRIGAAGGYSRGTLDIGDRRSGGEARTGHLAAYAGGAYGPVRVRIGAAWAGASLETDRKVAFTGYADHLRAGYDGSVVQAFGELGYAVAAGPVALEPFVGLASLSVKTDGFQETGGPAALAGRKASDTLTLSSLGARFDGSGQGFKMRGLVAWRHVLDGERAESDLAFAGGAGFTVIGAPIAEDSLAAEFGLSWKIGRTGSLEASYSGAFAEEAQDHAGRLTLSFGF
jgi:fibronectin-binding autotransporter adhesin